MSGPPKVRIVHETNPHKYFPALFHLAQEGRIRITGAHRYSVAREFLRAGLRDRTPAGVRIRHALGDGWFRLRLPFIMGETIVLGFAPWDWRLLVYRGLARRNRILYHTSWHDWRPGHTPRQPRPAWLATWLRGQWLAFVTHPNVTVVAITPVVAAEVAARTGATARVVPHAVPQVFFDAGARRARRDTGPLKLLFVGEVSAKKGIDGLLRLMAGRDPARITLTVVGDGPLARRVAAEARGGVTWLGPVHDRARLAGVMADHDVLILPSRRTPTWEEVFGIVIVEALAAGLAVIASDHLGPRTILGAHGPEGLFGQDDHAGMQRLIEALAGDRQHLHALAARQRPACAGHAAAQVSERWLAVIAAASGQTHPDAARCGDVLPAGAAR